MQAVTRAARKPRPRRTWPSPHHQWMDGAIVLLYRGGRVRELAA